MNNERQGNWLPVKDFEGLYEVSDKGEIYSLSRRIVRSDSLILNSPVGVFGYS